MCMVIVYVPVAPLITPIQRPLAMFDLDTVHPSTSPTAWITWFMLPFGGVAGDTGSAMINTLLCLLVCLDNLLRDKPLDGEKAAVF